MHNTDKLDLLLRHIVDQAHKRHYLNAIATAHEVLGLLLRRHSDALKDNADATGHPTSSCGQ